MKSIYSGLVISLIVSAASFGAAPHATPNDGGGRAPAKADAPKDDGCNAAKASAETVRAQLVADLANEKKIFPHLVAKLAKDEAYAKACRWFSETGQPASDEQIAALAKTLEASVEKTQAELGKAAARSYLESQFKAGRNPTANDRVLKALLDSVAKFEVEDFETRQLRDDLTLLAKDLQSGRLKPELPIQHEIKAWGPPGTAKFKEALEKEVARYMADYKKSPDFRNDVKAKLESLAVPMVRAAKLHQEVADYVSKNAKPKWGAPDALRTDDIKKAWQQEKNDLAAHRRNAPGGDKPADKDVTAAVQKIGTELEGIAKREREEAVKAGKPAPKVTSFANEDFLKKLAAEPGMSAAAVYHAVEQIRAARVEFSQGAYIDESSRAIANTEKAQQRAYAVACMKALEEGGKVKFDRAPNSVSFKESDVAAFIDTLSR